jgi:hypothetical protein
MNTHYFSEPIHLPSGLRSQFSGNHPVISRQDPVTEVKHRNKAIIGCRIDVAGIHGRLHIVFEREMIVYSSSGAIPLAVPEEWSKDDVPTEVGLRTLSFRRLRTVTQIRSPQKLHSHQLPVMNGKKLFTVAGAFGTSSLVQPRYRADGGRICK